MEQVYRKVQVALVLCQCLLFELHHKKSMHGRYEVISRYRQQKKGFHASNNIDPWVLRNFWRLSTTFVNFFGDATSIETTGMVLQIKNSSYS